MRICRDARFHFQSLKPIKLRNLKLYQLLCNGAAGDVAVRYHKAIEKQLLELCALLTIGTALADIPLVCQTSLMKCCREVQGDLLMQNRLCAWFDARLRIKSRHSQTYKCLQRSKTRETDTPYQVPPSVKNCPTSKRSMVRDFAGRDLPALAYCKEMRVQRNRCVEGT